MRKATQPRPRTALVLSGGGARGAYQVGVLQGLVDLGVLGTGRSGIDILVGASAGAINCGALAAYADAVEEGVRRLARVWGEMRPQQVFRTDLRSLGGIGARWVRDLSFGGVFGRVVPKSLLDNSPLRELLSREIPFRRIEDQVHRGALRALAVLATDLYSTHGLIFLDGDPELPLWRRGRWRVEQARVGVDHLMASSAIPLFFPPVEIDGRHLGDGCIRNTTPLSPAIHLGADRIVAVGVRKSDDGSELPRPARRNPPSIAQIASTLFAIMLDAIEVDVEHSERVNESVLRASDPRAPGPFRKIDVLWLSPSRELVDVAAELAPRVPRIVRYLLRGLGTEEATHHLTSYLLFDAEYCRRLIELGRQDVASRAAEVREFFGADAESRAASG